MPGKTPRPTLGHIRESRISSPSHHSDLLPSVSVGNEVLLHNRRARRSLQGDCAEVRRRRINDPVRDGGSVPLRQINLEFREDSRVLRMKGSRQDLIFCLGDVDRFDRVRLVLRLPGHDGRLSRRLDLIREFVLMSLKEIHARWRRSTLIAADPMPVRAQD